MRPEGTAGQGRARQGAAPRTVVVTGGASGIGLAVAEVLLADGWRPVLVDGDAAALERARQRFGQAVAACRADMTDEAAITQLFSGLGADQASLCGVVNCAGTGIDQPALETSIADFRRILDVNLCGCFLVSREAAKHMRAGAVVNVASVSGIRGNAGRSAYGASKGGVIALSQVLAAEWAGQGIRVNVVAPGPVDTPLARRVHSVEMRAAWVSAIPQGRYGTTREVAEAILFLLDDSRSGGITGHTLCVDGGFATAGIFKRAPAAADRVRAERC